MLRSLPSLYLEQMYLTPANNYGSSYGIYCHQGPTAAVAEQALYMCRNGDSSLLPREDTTLENWAVEFGLPPRVRGMHERKSATHWV